ncbi:MAG: hypothetical protein ACFFBP_20125 [Promethearchaeota archaeon]
MENNNNKYSKPVDFEFCELKDLRHIKIDAWSSERFKLKYANFYSKSILNQFNKYFNATIDYLGGSLLTEIEKKYKIYRGLIKRIAKDILSGISMENLLKSLIGYKGKIGLDLAVAELKTFYVENKIIPSCNEKSMISIRNSILSSKYWSEFGIQSWNDILEYTYGKEFLNKLKNSEDKLIFKKAILELKEFHAIKRRLPKYSDTKIKWISASVSNQRWQKFGISTWNDLLMNVFGDINLKHNLYEGKDGFKKAIEELQVFYEKNGKKPTSKDFTSISRVIYRGIWNNFGIKKWNDLLKYVFGEVNLLIQNKYAKKDGLNKIKQELKKFREHNDRLPKSNDEEISLIVGAVQRGLFKDQGIITWNDLLQNTFGMINREQKIYKGKKGFDKAIKELRNYYKIHNKVPAISDFDVIYRNIRCGSWKKFCINTWSELVIYCFGKKSIKFNKYKGQDGFKRAKQDLIEFNKNSGKLPIKRDMGKIAYAIGKGEYTINGINTWNDLLKHCFGEINYEKNKYIGIEGLKKAKSKIKEYKNKYEKDPLTKSKGMNTIYTYARLGKWKKFGINNWKELLEQILY